jgi:hypothetical protein
MWQIEKGEKMTAVQREKISEEVVYRGSPGDEHCATISVFIPENASNIQVKAYMKNEIWGGAHHPPKADTDDLGSIDYKECPMGGGDCPIAWSSVSGTTITSLPNGLTEVSAIFKNWAGRNDRTGKLLVTYQIEV